MYKLLVVRLSSIFAIQQKRPGCRFGCTDAPLVGPAEQGEGSLETRDDDFALQPRSAPNDKGKQLERTLLSARCKAL